MIIGREKFKFQKEKKAESQERIFKALEGEGKTFSELIRLTGLSKAVLIGHLKSLKERREIKREFDEKRGRVVYLLTKEALRSEYVKRHLFDMISVRIFNDVFDSAGRMPDKEFLSSFTQKIGALATYSFLIALSKKKQNAEEAAKWMDDFASQLQKYVWRRCLCRQIFGGPYQLKEPVEIGKPLPTFEEGKDGKVLVELPEAFKQSKTAEILKKLPKIQRRRLEEVKNALGDLYPQEVKRLDETETLLELREVSK